MTRGEQWRNPLKIKASAPSSAGQSAGLLVPHSFLPIFPALTFPLNTVTGRLETALPVRRSETAAPIPRKRERGLVHVALHLNRDA